MPEIDCWLKHYEDTHQDLTYPAVYWAAVNMVVLGTVGILWTLPIPDEFFEISPLLNRGTAFLMASAVYYFIISVSLAFGMLHYVLGVGGVHSWLMLSDFSTIRVSIGEGNDEAQIDEAARVFTRIIKRLRSLAKR